MSSIVCKAKNGYLREVLQLIESGCSVNVRDDNNYSALYWSACNGYPDICKVLLNSGSCINTQFRCGFTSLHAAADRGQVDCVRILIDWKPNIDIQNDRGETALHLSCYRGFVDIVRILIQAKANPFCTNFQNKTALQEAHSQQFDDITHILILYQTDLERLKTANSKKPLNQDRNLPVNRISWPSSSANNLSDNLVLLTPEQFAHQSPITRVNYRPPALNIPVSDYNSYDNSNLDGMLPETLVTSKQNMFAYNPGAREPMESEIQSPIMHVNSISPETMINFAEALQIELVKSQEENSALKSDKEKLSKKCDLFRASNLDYDAELKKTKQFLLEESELRQQTVRRSHQHQLELSKRFAEIESRGVNNSEKPSPFLNERVIKLCHKNILALIKDRRNKTGCFDWTKLCDKVRKLWNHSDGSKFLDKLNREWTLDYDYTLVGDLPVNHFGDGQRDGSCSLVFRIQHKSQFYILKMMINLINLQFVNHGGGHSLDQYLVDNFGPEYLIPLLLSGHPNIIQVLHYYEGSTMGYKKYQSLLVPQNLDVPIEMATRTTFLVLPEYPLSLKSFMLEQRDNLNQPLFGLSELFLLQFFYQLLSSIVFLQTKEIVHRDIKADNIFLDSQLRPVLGDFGFARRLHDHAGQPVRFVEMSQAAAGNSHAWAPELCRYSRCQPELLPQSVLLQDIYSKSDGFAVARMMYSILQPPNSPDTFPTSSVNSPNYKNSSIPRLPDKMSKEFRNILRDLVLNDPIDRPTVRHAMFRIGAILFSPSVEEVNSQQEMMEYLEAKLVMLASVNSEEWKREKRPNVVNIDESVKLNSLEIEAHFFSSITDKEFWGIMKSR